MKEYFKNLSQDIKNIISKSGSKYKIKEFEHQEEDGAVRDPKHTNILFEDETIRVIDVILPAKEEESFHRHERASVMYTDIPASIELYENMKSPNQISWSTSNPTPRFDFIPVEDMHKVKNVDDKQYRAFRIEFCADIMALPNHDVLSRQLCEFITSQKESLDLLRQKILLNESQTKFTILDSSKRNVQHKPDVKDKISSKDEKESHFLQAYPKQKPKAIRKSEVDLLRREAQNFIRIKRV